MSRLSARLVCLAALLLGAPHASGKPGPASQPADLLKHAQALVRRTARLRGLRARRKIQMGVLSRDEILKRIEKKLDEEYTPAEIAAEAAVLKLLGLLPETLDYRKAVLDLLRDQVAGFYDPKPHRLNLASWITMDLQGPALVHEICHALQDQHFNLRRLTRPFKDNSDRQLAQAALVEGDCTGVMLEHILAPQKLDLGSMPDGLASLARQNLTGGGSPVFKAAPAFLRETLVFPYIHGLDMMQRLRPRHPWSRVNVMYRRPPESTEQVLHYEKYWARERPERITPAPLPALTGYHEVKRDVLGELQLSIFLGQALVPSAAQRAAAGWGGDLLLAYAPDRAAPASAPSSGDGVRSADLLLVHLSSWDSEEDALEAANALRRVLVKRGLARREEAGTDRHTWIYEDRKERRWSIQLASRHVLLLAAIPAALQPQLQQQVWQRFRVGGRRVAP